MQHDWHRRSCDRELEQRRYCQKEGCATGRVNDWDAVGEEAAVPAASEENEPSADRDLRFHSEHDRLVREGPASRRNAFSLGCYWRGHRHARATTLAAPRHCSVNTKSCSGAILP